MTSTFVTGASGFIGTHLIDEMRRRGRDVMGITRGDVPGLITVPSYGPEADWTASLSGVATVVHLAARVHVMHETSSDPLADFREANVASTLNLARQAVDSGVKRFIFISSIKVNGEQTQKGKPFRADDPANPQDPYGISKAEAEQDLIALGQKTGLEITIIRPPLVYGRGVRGNFQSLARWAASGAPSILKALDNKRSFIHVDNLCDLIITTLDHKNAANRVFLASDGHDLSTHELLTLLMTAQGRTPRSIPVPSGFLNLLGKVAGKQDIVARLSENLQVDLQSTTEALDWVPPISVINGIESSFRR